MQVLFRQQHAQALLLQFENHVGHVLDDFRRQAFGRFVQQHQVGVAHQRSSHGKHLLLAPAHAAARAIRHLAQVRKHAEQLVRGPLRRALARRLPSHFQIFQHAEPGVHAPVLRYIPQPLARDPVWLAPLQRRAAKFHLAFDAFQQAHHRLEGGGFAGAVAAHQRHHFAAPHFEVHVVQYFCAPVPGAQLPHFEQRRSHDSAAWA